VYGRTIFEFAYGDFLERSLGSLGSGDRVAMFFALQVLVGEVDFPRFSGQRGVCVLMFSECCTSVRS
jgi:hypothetical protein